MLISQLFEQGTKRALDLSFPKDMDEQQVGDHEMLAQAIKASKVPLRHFSNPSSCLQSRKYTILHVFFDNSISFREMLHGRLYTQMIRQASDVSLSNACVSHQNILRDITVPGEH